MLDQMNQTFSKLFGTANQNSAQPQNTGGGGANDPNNAGMTGANGNSNFGNSGMNNNGENVNQQNQQNQQQQNAQQQQNGQAQNPLDSFNDIWNNPANDPKNGNQQNPNSMFSPNREALSKAVNSMNFAQNIDPALMQKALSGDVGSFGEILNNVARSVFEQGLLANSRIVETGVNKRFENFEGGLGKTIRSHTVRNSLMQENPALGHKAVKPLISALESQLSQQYPEASAQEIKDHVMKYMKNVAGLFANKDGGENDEIDGMGNPMNGGNSARNGETDWGTFFNG